jgi:hypothetical protein
METTAAPLTAAAVLLPEAPLVLRDVEDLDDAQFDADLADWLDDTDRVRVRADAVALADAIGRAGGIAASAHGLGLRAAILASC